MYLDTGSKGSAGARRIAVIGSGISGLSAAWHLSQSHEVVLYEAEARIGGHSNTVDVETARGTVAVDTGFIVYNEDNYPNLVAMFDHLGVKTELSNMSFSASIDAGRFEYCSDPLGLIGQKSNVIRPRFWRMISDAVKFSKAAPKILADPGLDGIGLGDYLAAHGYSQVFIDDHLMPMAAAIWSSTSSEMHNYPLKAFVRFFLNHGLLQLYNRPLWRTVSGGSRHYVAKLVAGFKGEIRLGTPVTRVERFAGGVRVIDGAGHADTFTDIVLASHADQSLAMLADPDPEERRLLGTFAYTPNTAILHSDKSLMPKRKSVWSSWNYVGEKNMGADTPLCVTYWMNKLQNIDKRTPLFVTLNPTRDIAPDRQYQQFSYTHPLFDQAAMAAQKQLWQLQGQRNTWFAGAYFGSGFHEDGLQSGLAAAEACGGVSRPWVVDNPSGRIFAGPARVAAE